MNAKLVSVAEQPATAEQKTAAATCEQTKVYKAFLAANGEPAFRPFLSKELRKALDANPMKDYLSPRELKDYVEEWSEGNNSSFGSRPATAEFVPLRVRVDGDTALLQAEAKYGVGRIRFVREEGAWRIAKEVWTRK